MLGQGLRRGCGPLGRGLSTSAAAAQAVPAIAGESAGQWCILPRLDQGVAALWNMF